MPPCLLNLGALWRAFWSPEALFSPYRCFKGFLGPAGDALGGRHPALEAWCGNVFFTSGSKAELAQCVFDVSGFLDFWCQGERDYLR